MRVLVAGFGDPRRFAGVKGLEFSPLSQADDPTEYDFVFLRPSLFGGIFPDAMMGDLVGSGSTVRPNKLVDAQVLQAQMLDISRRLVLLGQVHGLAVIPSAEEMIRYYEPKSMHPTVAQINQAIGDPRANFIEHVVVNLDVLEHWSMRMHSTQGSSGAVVMPGHPLARYIDSARFRWEAVFTHYPHAGSQMLAVAMDRSGTHRIAVEASAGGSYLYGIPEPANSNDLMLAIDCLREAYDWNSGEADIRSGTERSLEDRIQRGQDDIVRLAKQLQEAEEDLLEARRQREALIASRPEMVEAMSDYAAGRDQHSLALFHRAYERLKKYYRESYSGDEDAFLDWLEISDGKRRRFGKITNVGERHAPAGGIAPQPAVSDEQFEEARTFLQEVLERYMERVRSGR